MITLAVQDYNVSWLHDLLGNTRSGIEKPPSLSLPFFVRGSLRQMHTSYQHPHPALETTNHQWAPFSLMIATYHATTRRGCCNKFKLEVVLVDTRQPSKNFLSWKHRRFLRQPTYMKQLFYEINTSGVF